LDIENHKLKICYARYNGLIIRRDGNILEAGKVGRIPLGIVENRNYIEENIFFNITGIICIPLIGQGGGAGEYTNGKI
jgi:hypothetical protein